MTPATIKAARAGLNWTQERLAQEAGIHPKAVAYWEAPGRTPQRQQTPALQRIADAFDRAGLAGVRIDPRAAVLDAFDRMPPEQQLQAALQMQGIGG